MKTEFILDSHVAFAEQPKIKIIGTAPRFKPYVNPNFILKPFNRI